MTPNLQFFVIVWLGMFIVVGMVIFLALRNREPGAYNAQMSKSPVQVIDYIHHEIGDIIASEEVGDDKMVVQLSTGFKFTYVKDMLKPFNISAHITGTGSVWTYGEPANAEDMRRMTMSLMNENKKLKIDKVRSLEERQQERELLSKFTKGKNKDDDIQP